jgi:Uma2 family endonuclease
MADVKLHLQAGGEDVFYYPDLMVCCDPSDDHPYYRERPCLLVEILSESTERIDRREKWMAYTQIPSLQGYLILSRERTQASLCRRDADWRGVHVDEPDQRLDLPCVELAPTLAALYAG